MMKMETCNGCGRTLPVEGSITDDGVELTFRGWFYGRQYKDQITDTVTFTSDPFAEEIYHDGIEMWICENCWYQSAMDV